MRQEVSRSTKNAKKETNVLGAISNFYAQVVNGEDVRTDEDKMIDTIKLAHAEWRNAEAYFQNVTDPDLIDYAIYRVEAAKTKYSYLMKMARENDIRMNF